MYVYIIKERERERESERERERERESQLICPVLAEHQFATGQKFCNNCMFCLTFKRDAGGFFQFAKKFPSSKST